MLHAALLFLGSGTSLEALPDGPVAVVLVKLGKEVEWGIRPIEPPRALDFSRALLVSQQGKSFRIRPDRKWPGVDRIVQGGDGSLMVRQRNTEIVWSTECRIFWRGADEATPGVISHYRDRVNYIVSTTETAPGGVPLDAPQSFLVKNGDWTKLGHGSAVAWESNGLIALESPYDSSFSPSGQETAIGSMTILLGMETPFSIPGFDYLCQMQDGSALLSRCGGVIRESNGYLYPESSFPDKVEILQVRRGREVKRWLLPAGWKVVGASPSGWLFARFMPRTPIDQRAASQGSDQWAANPERLADSSAEDEALWKMWIIYDGLLSPIRTKKPPKTKGMLWRGTRVERDAVSIHVFLGSRDLFFRLSPGALRN